MRVAFVSTYAPSTGTLNEYAHHFIKFLRQKPDVREVVVLADELPDAPNATIADTSPGLAPLRRIACWRFGGLTNAWRIVQAVRAARPDIVLFNIQFATFGGSKVPASLGLLAPALVRAAGFPCIVLLHNIMETVDLKQAGYSANPLSERIIRMAGTAITRMLLRADLVALTIPKYVEILETNYSAKNVLLAPHGTFEQAPPPPMLPAGGPLQIMTFGKFGTYKKVDVLIDAFKLLQARYPGLELVIAGTNSPNAPGYLEGVRDANPELPGLRFTGYVAEQEVPQLFYNASAVVFPYDSTTGSSGVLHQAGNYGRAVVMPNIGDLAEVIAEEGYVGEFFEPGDAASLAEAIDRVLADPAHREELGMRNYLAACGLPITDVVDWYLLHAQTLLQGRGLRTRLAGTAQTPDTMRPAVSHSRHS